MYRLKIYCISFPISLEAFMVEVDGTLFTNMEDLTDIPTLIQGRVAISKPYSDCILVVYPLGNSIKVTKLNNSLTVIVATTKKLEMRQKGLLGLLNGDQNDDFTMRDDSRLNSTVADDKQVHYKFGLNCKLCLN